jgi:hypothetical protein
MKTKTLVEWKEPGIGYCQYWQIGNNWWGWATPKADGYCSSMAECLAELQAIIEPDPVEFGENEGKGE